MLTYMMNKGKIILYLNVTRKLFQGKTFLRSSKSFVTIKRPYDKFVGRYFILFVLEEFF